MRNLPPQLLFSFLISILMLFLLPFTKELALYPHSLPTGFCPSGNEGIEGSVKTIEGWGGAAFVYMFSHASFLHWLVNSWCLVCIAKWLTPRRCLMAYLTAVLVSFLPVYSQPTAGFSVIIFYLYGYMSLFIYRRYRTTFLYLQAFLIVGFLMPHVAAALHLLMFALGFLTYLTEQFINKIRNL